MSRRSQRRGLGSALMLLTLAAAGPAPAVAQEPGTVVGRVADAQSGQPLVGVQVHVVASTRGVLTDAEGRYALVRVPAGRYEVRALLIGYGAESRQVEVRPGESVVLDFDLRMTAIELDAVVVNAATGQADRLREVGTNVATLRSEELDAAPLTQLADAFVARAAGVTLQDVTGTVGTAQRIRIRGANSLSLSNEPLVYVDGVQISTSAGGIEVGGQQASRLNDLNPGDIERIEILKGPAASALYGTAAANGVIQITTRRGRPGAPRWAAWAEAGALQDRTDYPSNHYPYVAVSPAAPVLRDGALDRAARPLCPAFVAATGACTIDDVLSFSPLEDPRTTPFSDGARQRYGLSVAGGSDRTTYYLAGDLVEERGVVSFNEQQRLNVRANVDAQVGDALTLALSSAYSAGELVLNANDNSALSPLLNGLLGSAVYYPTLADGTRSPSNYGFGIRPEDMAHLPTRQEIDRFMMGVSGTWRPGSWLSGAFAVGLDYGDRFDHETLQPNRLYLDAASGSGYRSSERSRLANHTASASLSGTFEPAEGLVSTTTAGATYLRNARHSTFGYGAGIVEGTGSLGASSRLFRVDEAFEEVVTVGAFLRHQLAWQDRWFLSAAVRGDDNSAFGSDFGLVYYPAFSLSWVLAEEPWFPRGDLIGDLRLRGAYGRSGLRPGFRDAATYYKAVAVQHEGVDVSAVTLARSGNDRLEPEKSTEWEAGLDAGFLRGRLGVELTYFDKTSVDALIERQIPSSFGLTQTVFDNLGSIRNRGTELAVDALLLDREDLRLRLRFTNTTLDNEVLELGGGVDMLSLNRGVQRHVAGSPAGAFYQRPVVWDDADGNGLLAQSEVSLGAEAVYIGPSLPTWMRTLGGELTLFGAARVATVFEARGGNYQYDMTEAYRCLVGIALGTGGCEANTGRAPLRDQAALIGYMFMGSSHLYITPADFIKWRELSLSLDAPASLAARAPILEGATLTLAGRNLAGWTDYPGLDPEINEKGAENWRQNEFNTQPPLRHLSVRFDLRF